MNRSTQLSFSRQLRRRQTDCERYLWRFLRDRRFLGLKFRRQHPIGPFVVDFCCLESRVILELDGGQHISAHCYDRKRSQYLEQEGYRVLRFWDNEVLREVDAVFAKIDSVLKTPHPALSPRGRG